MSPIRMGKAKVKGAGVAELGDRTTALSLALFAGAEELDGAAVERARRVLDRAQERSKIAGDHTVVALAGATGSGKSSLFNALVGEQVAEIGARRPTTATPTAAVWGESDASELLDWLRVDARHLVGPAGDGGAEVADRPSDMLSGKLNGLVLLDLPDFDSRELSHRREAERILELVDMFVWVTDPQKYADARLHDEFVALMAHHDAVTLAVLNQTDRLDVDAVKALKKDFTKLLGADGVHGASVLATSAVTGTGVPELLQRLANVVAGQAASRQRLNADVVAAARRPIRRLPPAASTATRWTRRSPERPVCRSSSMPSAGTTDERPSPTRASSSRGGPVGSRLTRSDACGSIAPGAVRRSPSRSRAQTCVPSWAGPPSRRPAPRPSRRSTWPRAASSARRPMVYR